MVACIAFCELLAARCNLPAGQCLVLTAYCLLPAASCNLPAASPERLDLSSSTGPVEGLPAAHWPSPACVLHPIRKIPDLYVPHNLNGDDLVALVSFVGKGV